MAIVCPDCGCQFDVTLFQFGNVVSCDCGRSVTLSFFPHSPRARRDMLRRIADEAHPPAEGGKRVKGS